MHARRFFALSFSTCVCAGKPDYRTLLLPEKRKWSESDREKASCELQDLKDRSRRHRAAWRMAVSPTCSPKGRPRRTSLPRYSHRSITRTSFSPRGLLPGLEEQSRTRGSKSGGVADQPQYRRQRLSLTPNARSLSRSPSSPSFFHTTSFTQCGMGRLVHSSLGSSYLIAHVLHYPPPTILIFENGGGREREGFKFY